MERTNFLRKLMLQAWQFVKRNGLNMSQAMHIAWLNAKLKKQMTAKICKFYYQKVDGTLREAYGTLKSNLLPQITNEKKQNETIQIYYDTEKKEFRSFKKVNLIKIEY